LNIHGINDVGQTEKHTAEPLVPEPSPVVEVAIEKLKRYKSPSIDQIVAELIQVRANTLCSEITDFLILFGIRKNYNSSGRNLFCTFL